MSRSISVSLALVVSVSLSFVVSVALCSAGCSDPPVQQRSPRPRDAGPEEPVYAGCDASARALDAGPDAAPEPADAGVDALPQSFDAGLDVTERRDAGLGAEMFAIRPRGTQLTVRAAGSLAWTIDVVRADGFESPIVLEAFGLPAGVRAAPVVATVGEASVDLVLEAEASALIRADAAFSLQASADGWVRRARITVSVTR